MVGVALASCQDSLSLDGLSGKSRLVVYAFPSEGDTLEIKVSATQPVNGRAPVLTRPEVSCRTNGSEKQVVLVGDTLADGLPLFTFRACGHRACGDKVSIEVRADGYPVATAETTIPKPVAIDGAVADTVWYNGGVYTQLRLTFRDSPEAQYYAVRVRGKSVEDGSEAFLEVETSAEPLLNNYSATRPDFDAWNDYYHKLYTFDDSSFRNAAVTVRLNVLQQSWIQSLQPELFVLSDDYYQMLKALNNIRNNDLSSYGLSFAYSSYSNVRGGYGCVAGYAETR